MPVDDPDTEPDQRTSPRGRRRWFWRALRFGLPVAFIVLTAVSVGRIVAEGTPDGVETVEAAAADRVTIAATGDIGTTAAGESTLRAMAARNPDLYVALGGLSDRGPGSEAAWCELVRSIVGPVVPVELVADDHEPIDPYETCLSDRLNAVGDYARQYYFDIGDLARVIVIPPALADRAWLESAVDDARTRGIHWVIVASHGMSQDLVSALIAKRVDLVLTAGDASYQRSMQLAAPRDGCAQILAGTFAAGCVADDGVDGAYARGAGTVFVVAGAAGAPLAVVQDAGHLASAMGADRDPRHGFVEIVVTRDELSSEFIGSSPGDYADRFRVSEPVS